MRPKWGIAGLAVIVLTAAIFLLAKKHLSNPPVKTRSPTSSNTVTRDTIVPTYTGFALSIPVTQPPVNEARVRTKTTIPLQSFHIKPNAAILAGSITGTKEIQ